MTCKRGELTPASDGVSGRCVGVWSKEKVYYIQRYAEIFSTGMKDRFPNRIYVDLFAGPGMCVLDDGSGEFNGSPIAALRTTVPFSRLHLVENGAEEFAALEIRVNRSERATTVKLYPEDANAAVKKIRPHLASSSLALAVIDPNGLAFSFDALKTLTDDRRVDLIYLFPDGMDIRRNLERFLETDTRLDNVLGTTDWRERMKEELRRYPSLDENGVCPGATTLILRTFKDQLAKLGYIDVLSGDEIRFKNRKQAPLYLLVFASKHPRGHEFWKKIQAIGAWGQRTMFS